MAGGEALRRPFKNWRCGDGPHRNKYWEWTDNEPDLARPRKDRAMEGKI